MSRRIIAAGLLLAALGLGRGAAPGPAVRAASAEQVVFSVNVLSGFGTFSGTATPVGFWVWCEAESANPYQGECNGSLYFYALGGPQHVTGTIRELAPGQYQMHVTSVGGFVCTLTNALPVTSGPTNKVTVACTSPAGTTTVQGVVVNVTGP